MDLKFYNSLLDEIKNRVRTAQIKATLSANAEMIMMYWDIGKLIYEQQQLKGWGATVTQRLAIDMKNELPDLKGFSERNLKFMVQFYKTYESEFAIGKHSVSQLPWGHNIILMQKVKDENIRLWYVHQTIQEGWSREVLSSMLKSNTFQRQGNATTNFEKTLPNSQSELVRQVLKDPYIFDFLTLAEPFMERELETELVKHIEKFLIELGTGFAFVGRQYHFELEQKDYYIDLLFYHLKMRRFIVIDLKKGDFKPEYAGKMNFYCSAVDDLIRHSSDEGTIGLILCENKSGIVAEYALRDLSKPIGISEYELTRSLPENLKPSLPSIEDIENELSKKTA